MEQQQLLEEMFALDSRVEELYLKLTGKEDVGRYVLESVDESFRFDRRILSIWLDCVHAENDRVLLAYYCESGSVVLSIGGMTFHVNKDGDFLV
jgi:hypothetical protein